MTIHSLERAKERANLNRAAAIKIMEKAYARGLSAADLPANERRYLSAKEKTGVTVRYFSGYCFFYNDSKACITMYHAPSWFFKKSNYDGKTKIRNPKKYFNRHYSNVTFV